MLVSQERGTMEAIKEETELEASTPPCGGGEETERRRLGRRRGQGWSLRPGWGTAP